MIISHISPEHLCIVQQALLIHHISSKKPDDILLMAIWSPDRPEIQLYVLANILGHTVASLKHVLSKLQSVLTFISKKKMYWGEPFPGSVHISFYHASFMEFLLDKARSGEYVRHGSHWGGSLQNRLGDERTCGTTLASAYVLRRLSAAWSQLQMKKRKSEWK